MINTTRPLCALQMSKRTSEGIFKRAIKHESEKQAEKKRKRKRKKEIEQLLYLLITGNDNINISCRSNVVPNHGDLFILSGICSSRGKTLVCNENATNKLTLFILARQTNQVD